MIREANGAPTQTDAIRDFIFPLGVVQGDKLLGLAGTGFLIGSNSHGLSAEHCTKTTNGRELSALFIVNDRWEAVPVLDSEPHPTEDVAVLRLATKGLKSFLNVSTVEHHSSLRYRGWGYPDDTYHEMVTGWETEIRPDLVYAEGYIRRRLTDVPVPVRGTALYELSDIMGNGASGAPIVTAVPGPNWQVVGSISESAGRWNPRPVRIRSSGTPLAHPRLPHGARSFSTGDQYRRSPHVGTWSHRSANGVSRPDFVARVE